MDIFFNAFTFSENIEPRGTSLNKNTACSALLEAEHRETTPTSGKRVTEFSTLIVHELEVEYDLTAKRINCLAIEQLGPHHPIFSCNDIISS
jgi:hypothetical protein